MAKISLILRKLGQRLHLHPLKSLKMVSVLALSVCHSSAIRAILVEITRERKKSTNGVHIVPSVIVVDDDTVSAATGSLKLIDTSQSSVTSEGKSADKPIAIPASPLKVPSPLIESSGRADKPAHLFFLSKLRTSTQTFPSKTSSPKHVNKAAPYPDRSSQHVKGFQTPLQTLSPPIFPCREQRTSEKSLEDSASYAFLKQKYPRDYLPASLPSLFPKVQSLSPGLNHVLDEQKLSNHLAVTRFMNKPSENLRSRRPWSEKWRPLRAKEVLGNEQSAIYLRNWLCALELQLEDGRMANSPEAKDVLPKGRAKASSRGVKRPRVVRAVEKIRGRKKLRHDSDDDDDWIVHTDEESDNDVPIQPEVDAYGELIPEPPPASLEYLQDSDIRPLTDGNVGQDLGQLHNTILLTGSHGNGKTAAVYACAEELNWEVFEVYPGIGKRNGASLDSYIGEVGKNHLVGQTHRNSSDFLRALFRQREDLDAVNASPSSHEDGTDIQGQNAKPAKPIRQSVILLEEVDILFKEDSNFWNTVTSIIKECKRPVICTCNGKFSMCDLFHMTRWKTDTSLVPVHDLPLQAILEFKPCPTDATVSYLQNLCLVEGYFVESDILSQLYTRSGLSSEALQSVPDLRRTINALQVICLPIKETICNEMPPVAAKTGLGGIEFLSYMDSYLVKDPCQVIAVWVYI